MRQLLDPGDRGADRVGCEVCERGLEYREAFLGQFCGVVHLLQRVVELVGCSLCVREPLPVLAQLRAEPVDLLRELAGLVRGVAFGELERDVSLFELLERALLFRYCSP